MKMAHFIPTNASIVPTRIPGPCLRSAPMVHQTAWPFSPNLTSRKYLPPLPQSHALTQSSYSVTDHHSPIPDSTKIQPASQFRTLSLPPPPPKRPARPTHIFISFAAKFPSHAPTRTRVYHNLRVSPEKAAGRVGPVDVIPAAPLTHPPLTTQGRMHDIYTNKREDDPRGAVFPTPMRKLLPAGGGADRSKISACSVCFAAWVERYFFFFLILSSSYCLP
jgi:hypothetical protein